MSNIQNTNGSFFSFLEHFNFIEDDSSSYEVGINDDGFSYLDLGSEKKIKQFTFEEKQNRETTAALDGSTRARGQSNIAKVESIDHDEICLDTDLMAILKDIEERKNKPAFFPLVLAVVIFLGAVWISMPLYLDLPAIAMTLYGILYLPLSIVLLYNTRQLDHSRRNVQFSYRIEGKGKTAFDNINNAISALNHCGQKLIYIGRQHFEDTRYTGGANSLPKFAAIQISRSRPPLLDLNFDVWHLRAFQQDFFFMPDHLLVFQGSNAGGISYANLKFDLSSEDIQARDLVEQTHDSTVTGKTWRFINKDGSPDQRFNNNIQIPILEYGILKLNGSGIDFSIYASNKSTSDSVPGQFDSMLQIARKPVRKLAEERRAEAIKKRRQKLEGTFQTILEAMCCMMVADRKVAQEEIQIVCNLMKRIKAPWEKKELTEKIKQFLTRVKTEGLDTILEPTCIKLSKIENHQQREVIIKCLDQVANADGTLDEAEIKVKKRLIAFLSISN